MIPTRFEYCAPPDVAGCVAALGTDARILAGGTWVLPEMGRAESRPARLVDLRRAGLDRITAENGGVRLGAMTTYSAVLASPEIARHAPLLRLMADGITGGWALRNQATLGGSVASARPQSDVPGALAVCGATAFVSSPRGYRTVPVAQLAAGAMRTTLAPDELVTGFAVPSWAEWGSGYVKIKRGTSSWPIATAGAHLQVDDDGRCVAVRLVLGGVCATPLVVDVSDVLVGTVPDRAAVDRAGVLAGAAVRDPWGDVLAPAAYRAAVAAPVARRALAMAAADAGRVRQRRL